MPRSKPFAIATEGATTDGREISREWIAQMAETYDPKTYTAVGNLEHLISVLPDSPFSAYGKVLELGTREADILGEKKMQLTAVFDANDAIVALQKSGKKMFCSIEINPNFAKTGKAYLQGLAFTDTPASLGTEVMQFAAAAKENPFAGRKKDAANLFTAAVPVELEFEAEQTPGDTLFSKVKALLGLEKKDAETRFADLGNAVETIAVSQKETLSAFARIEKEMAALGAAVKLTAEAIESRRVEFAALAEKLAKTDDGTPRRPAADGSSGAQKTDC